MLPYCEHLRAIGGVEIPFGFDNVAVMYGKICKVVLILTYFLVAASITFPGTNPLLVLELGYLVSVFDIVGL
jgi:hypothetical protein